eukprot:gene7997-12462_t
MSEIQGISLDDDPLPSAGANLLSQDQKSILDDDESNFQKYCGCKHPIAAIFLLFFKVLGILSYLFLSFFPATNSFVIIFIVCIIFFAFDFWVVKNICGRLMVGLRWWNDVKEDGSSEWRFETKKDTSTIGPSDSRFFWLVLFGYPLFWGLLTITCILTKNFEYLLLIFVAVIFGMVNVVGYIRCFKDMTTKAISSKLFGFVGGKYLEYLTGGSK